LNGEWLLIGIHWLLIGIQWILVDFNGFSWDIQWICNGSSMKSLQFFGDLTNKVAESWK